METSQARESFSGLLLLHRGRAGLRQRDLAARARIGLRSIQDWEGGVTHPTSERLRRLIRALLEVGGLSLNFEAKEARQLWTAVERESPRMHTSFDEEWFALLLAAHTTPKAGQTRDAILPRVAATEVGTGGIDHAQDWGEAPGTDGFVGRADELALLRKWVLDDRCRLVAIIGMGGIGKTSLAAKLAQEAVAGFERVYWRSLRNALPVTNWLTGAIGFISDQQMVPPSNEMERVSALLQLLRAKRCLLVLDNSETLFEPGLSQRRYRAGMEGYGRLLQDLGERSHQSCLVLTSREAPPELALLSATRELEIHGLGIAEAQAMLADKQLTGDAHAWRRLVNRYDGNGLVLKIVGETIRQVYAGHIAAFLDEVLAGYGAVFGGIRRLLDVQAERLPQAERDVMTRLAIEREPVSVAELTAGLAPRAGRNAVIEAVEDLRRRSLVERGERSATFTLQSMVLEYVTDRLVESVVDEVRDAKPVLLIEQPLIKAQATDYVREAQERLIGRPILQRLKQHNDGNAEQRLIDMLGSWRGSPPADQGYGPGNVINLLRLLRGDLRGMDLSHLAIRQAYLALVDIQAGSLAGAHLAETALAEAFSLLRSVALSADGALLVAGTAIGELWLWRVADRTPLLRLPAHTGQIWSVELSADGRLMVSSGDDGMVRLWETSTGRPIAMLQERTGGASRAALSADGRTVAAGGGDGIVRVWDAATGYELQRLQGHSSMVWRVALSADGRLLASGGGDGTVRLWELGGARPPATLHGHTGGVFGVALSADGDVLATSGADGTVRLWEVSTGRPRATLEGHTGVVWDVALSADGHVVVSGGEGGTVRLWETATGRLLARLDGHTNEVMHVALSRDGQLVASCGLDTAVRLWDAKTGRPLAALHGNSARISDLALTADGQLLATKSGIGTRLWDAATLRPLSTPQGFIDQVWRVALSGDGQLLAGGLGDGTVCLWETSTGRQLATLEGHTGAIWSLALSADGRLVASSSGDRTVRVWDTTNRRQLSQLHGHTAAVWRVALSAGGELLASAGGDGTVRLWETRTGRALAVLEGHTGGVFSVALCADGHLLASSGDDGTVRLWDTRTGRSLVTVNGQRTPVWCVALSAQGNILASGSFDGMVRVWEPVRSADSSEWRQLATFQAHSGSVQALALSADGKLLVSGGPDGLVQQWDPRTGACLRTLQQQGRYAGLDITGLTGVTEAQRAALHALGAIEAVI